jgi:hypothetical protein
MHRSKRRAGCNGLLDYLVGAGEQGWRYFKAERSGSLEIDNELEPSRLLYRQIGRLSALEDAAGIAADVVINVGQICAVAHQTADFREFTRAKHC